MSSFLAPDFSSILDHLLQLYSEVQTSSKNGNLQQAAKKPHSESYSLPEHTGVYGIQKTVFIMQRC